MGNRQITHIVQNYSFYVIDLCFFRSIIYIFFHSCGALGPILDELMDMGINGIWHQANRYDEKEFVRKCYEKKVTAYLHPDRQNLVPFGTLEQIREQIRKYADIYHRIGGGGIFYIEIENDAPFENVKTLIESVHEFR